MARIALKSAGVTTTGRECKICHGRGRVYAHVQDDIGTVVCLACTIPLTPEERAEIQARYYPVAAEELRRYEATVQKLEREFAASRPEVERPRKGYL